MNGRLFDKTTGAGYGIWQREDTWKDRVARTGNQWLIDPLISRAREVAHTGKFPVLIDIGPSSAVEVLELGAPLKDCNPKIVVVEADKNRVCEVKEGIFEPTFSWKNIPSVYHGNGWEFGAAIDLLNNTLNHNLLNSELVGLVAMNNLAIAANYLGIESSRALINGFMNNARDYLSPLATVSLSIATAGLLIESPPPNFSDKSIRFVVRPGSVKEARFMGGLRTNAEHLYSKVWDVWLDTLVRRGDFCFLDTNNNRVDSIVKEYSTVSTGHDFWSLPHSEEMTNFKPT